MSLEGVNNLNNNAGLYVAVLGLGTLLCCGAKKEQPQNIDA